MLFMLFYIDFDGIILFYRFCIRVAALHEIFGLLKSIGRGLDSVCHGIVARIMGVFSDFLELLTPLCTTQPPLCTTHPLILQSIQNKKQPR